MRRLAADFIIEQRGKILFVKRGIWPYKGKLALPGGRLEGLETIEQTLKREAKEETGLDVKPLDIVGVYSDPKRDPRRIIAVTFVCKIKGGKLRPGSDAAAVVWQPIRKLPWRELAFDHAKILKDYLKWKKSKRASWSSKR